jgi:hypothetical protein
LDFVNHRAISSLKSPRRRKAVLHYWMKMDGVNDEVFDGANKKKVRIRCEEVRTLSGTALCVMSHEDWVMTKLERNYRLHWPLNFEI